MIARIGEFLEFLWLYFKGFRPVEFARGDERITLHACGWRANGTGRMRRAKDAVAYLDSAEQEQWKQIYCGMTPFLVSDKGNVKHIDGRPAKMALANGRYQLFYKPEDARGRGRNGRDHKKRVYRSTLVAMAFLDFKKGDETHEVHHVNGYRTDDRLANLMVVTHEEHIRIHNMGPCGLSGEKDGELARLAAAAPLEIDEAECVQEPKPEAATQTQTAASPSSKKRRRRSRKPSDRADEKPVANAQEIKQSEKAEDEHAAKVESPAAPSSSALESPVEQTAAEQHASEHVVPSKPEPAQAALSKPAPTQSSSPQTKPAETNASQEHAKPRKSETQNWTRPRTKLDAELSRFLEENVPASGIFPPNDRITKRAKPVYRALKPFLTCPDAITQFDAALSCVRMIARSEAQSETGTAAPAPVQSLLGAIHNLMKTSVKDISNQGELERACLEELLAEEAASPIYKGTSSARRFEQCRSIAHSRNERPENEAR